MKAKRMQNPIAKLARSALLRKCSAQIAQGERLADSIAAIGVVRPRVK